MAAYVYLYTHIVVMQATMQCIVMDVTSHITHYNN